MQAVPGGESPLTFSHRLVCNRYFPDPPAGVPAVAISAGSARSQFPTVISSKSLLPLQRPVSLPSKIGNENMGTVYALTAAARRNASLREGGGLGRSPKTEGACGQQADLTPGAVPPLGHKTTCAPPRKAPGIMDAGY